MTLKILLQHNTGGLLGQLSGVLELPADLELAKKSLMSTLSALYAIIVVCVCVTCTATEIITEKGTHTKLFL